MRYINFKIKNFKGIKEAELKLNQSGQGRIYTLVGLNECGKTTILEAINTFSPDLAAEPLFQKDIFRKVQPKDLVPKHRKDNFTGNVEIEASIEVPDEDRDKICDYLYNEKNLETDVARFSKIITVTKIFKFEKSDYKEQKNHWGISLYTKTKRAKIFKSLLDTDREIWNETIQYIRTLIPSICYFPTFLFEFPSRVYLSNTPEQYEPQNSYYKQIVQDVLDSLGRDLTIEEHIVKRVEHVDEGVAWNFFKFWQSDRKEQIDAVMNLLGNQITKSVFTRWNEIFGSRFTKNIKIEWNVESNQQNPPIFLSFNVQDGTSTYSIAERSLGFRWFFCFLLFTQFRKSRRDGGTLFLLDEPASNLHATAQQQLLESFSSVTEGNNNLIYSTHSHYMINPKWLESAFIVQNEAIEYDDEFSNSHEYQLQETNISVFPYRQFVGENPDKETYYQPILDSLDYSPSILEHQSDTIMVEGKGDYYVFTYFKDVIFASKNNIMFLPSSGADDLGPLISIYLGWGYSFKVLLDDDKKGKSAKERYLSEWFLQSSIVNTIGDLDSSLKNKKLESLISIEGKNIIKSDLCLNKLSKKQLVRFFQDKLALNKKVKFDKETLSNFKLIFSKLRKI